MFLALALGILVVCASATVSTAALARGVSAGPRVSLARAPVISDVHCVPAPSCPDPRRVSPGAHLLIAGKGLRAGMTVIFRARGGHSKSHLASVGAKLRKSTAGLIVVVPSKAVTGHIVIKGASGRRSRPFGPIRVTRRRKHPKAANPGSAPAPASTSPTGSPLEGSGMWIWHLDKSDGGSPDAVAARAQSAGIKTLFIKSGDGPTNYWSQFSSDTVSALKSRGLRVCAWQYVYGRDPVGEAALGARAVSAGADCLVIDAEAEYEGRYASAQRYIKALREKVGADYPIGLAAFPYVDYHPRFPFSVFLGPGGAQYNAPQMYWKAIGTSVDTVYSHTFVHNRIYQRPIFPLGQTYQSPSTSELVHFRALAAAYSFTGLSFWDWEETNSTGWSALSRAAPPPDGFTPTAAYPTLAPGAKGDEVIWLQQHLASAVSSAPTNGVLDSATENALRSFQSDHGLAVSGRPDPATWQALLALSPVAVDWTANTN